MDTSQEYVKMCKLAEEIQGNHDWYDGDFVVTHDGIDYVYGDRSFVSWMEDNETEEWLLKMRFSGEQLWLAFVMKKKFNKTWDGEKWVIIS